MNASHSELLLLPDGRILVHNLTPGMAALLQQLDRGDRTMMKRARKASRERMRREKPQAKITRHQP
jgi:hypothetical protein